MNGHAPGFAASRVARRCSDDRFFVGFALVILTIVAVGFAPTYFLAGVFRAKLPSAIIHVHAVIFTSWILLFVFQIALVSSHRTKLHRQFGVFGGLLAAGVVVLGFLAATDSYARGFSPPHSGIPPSTFYAIPMFEIGTFATLVCAGFSTRKNGPAHKRLMLIATIELLGPAIGRWPIGLLHTIPPLISGVILLLLLVMAAYDYWTLHKIHGATALGGGFVILSQTLAFPVGHSIPWRLFAASILRLWAGR